MNKNLTDIILIIDRSGSMDECKKEAENGINNFISEQKKQVGEAILTLIQFDNEYEIIHKGKNIKDVENYSLIPRGFTALLDAIGKGINETGERLRNMQEDQRPGLVICVIVTDGGENASHEFKKDQIKRMIELQQNTYQWKFIFLGANQDAFAEANGIGIASAGTSIYNVKKSNIAYSNLSNNVSRMRTCSLDGQAINCCFTEEEKKSMN